MNAAETTTAILLRRMRFGESGQILVWLSPDHGKIRTASRRSARKGAPVHPPVDLFYRAEIQFAPGRRSDLHALREVRLLDTWEAVRSDYRRLLAASYFAELCDLLSEPGHPAPGLFDLLGRALGYLGSRAPTPQAVGFFEAEACRVLGLGFEGSPLGALEAHAGRIPANRRVLLEALG